MIHTWSGGLPGQPLQSKPVAYASKVFGAVQVSAPAEIDEPRDLDEPQSEPPTLFSPAVGQRTAWANAAALRAAASQQPRSVERVQGDAAIRQSARLALEEAALKANPDRLRLEQRAPDPRLAAARVRTARCSGRLLTLQAESEALWGSLQASEVRNTELLQLVQEMQSKQSQHVEEASQLREEMAILRGELAEARLRLQGYEQAREREMMRASSYTHAYY
mmetsp:Transcript_146344/g.364987  ORF Transcript_146344/g.364987 Transcript_146344/m.364987 type:complete len:221 (+) Transcript_146344:68-730(+)